MMRCSGGGSGRNKIKHGSIVENNRFSAVCRELESCVFVTASVQYEVAVQLVCQTRTRCLHSCVSTVSVTDGQSSDDQCICSRKAASTSTEYHGARECQ